MTLHTNSRGRGSKYRAIPVVIDGLIFPSKKEGKRYSELKLLERAGQIMALTLHPKFDLIVNGKKVGIYTPDFQYVELQKPNYSAQGKSVIEEIKGFAARDFALRRKLFCALYPQYDYRQL